MKSHNAFITNGKETKLKKRLYQLIKHSGELKFLVGFFYFSGWKELYKALKENEEVSIKLLVGLKVDHMLGKLVEVDSSGRGNSNREIADQLLASFTKALNSEEMDHEEFYEQIDFFLELLEKDQLIIRKTMDPNHAKLYVFKTKEELQSLRETFFITGSSNLTRSVVLEQNEFNVEISDYGTEEAEEYFDALWNTAVKISEDDAVKEYLLNVIKNRTQTTEITPYEAYVLVLKTYLDLMEQKQVKPQIMNLLEDRGYKRYSYQIDAVNQALTIVQEYNGAIIADVVGLGKSVIASLVAKSLGKRGMIICPPGLMGEAKNATSGWYKYRNDFKLYDWEVQSSGDLEKAAKYVQEWGDDIEVVVIDEAHRFRNQDTQNYEYLSSICRGRTVLLLSATPFNNSPADIFALLKLFIIPGKSGITLGDNLEARFMHYENLFRRLSFIVKNHTSTDPLKRERAERYYYSIFESTPIDIAKVRERSQQLAQEIKNVITPVLIRRNRLDLKNDPVYSKEVKEISEVENPKELFFELSKEQSLFYDDVQTIYFGETGKFTGAIYQPFIYEQEIDEENLDEEGNRSFLQQRNLFEFMRRLLVKRFESSFGAFRQSIDNFIGVHERVQEFIKNTGKYILDRSLIEKIYDATEEEIEKALEEFSKKLETENRPRHDRIYLIDEFAKKEEFLENIDADIILLKKIKGRVDELKLASKDPKARSIIKEIESILDQKSEKNESKRKVIVFSEYVDTVKHLEVFFKKAFPDNVFVVDGSLSKKRRKELLENFDASTKIGKQRNDFEILLTSDVLSEGQNLNRAGAIINYDIPWNPTRVIQRVGRINRIGKKVFSKLHIYNFFPTEQGADIVKSREIAAQKMFLIHSTLGEDAKIFDVEEEPTPSELFNRINKNPDESEEQGTLTRIRSLYSSIEKSQSETIERISELPLRVKTAKHFGENELLVFRKKGLGFFINLIEDTSENKPAIQTIYSIIESLNHIECSIEEPRISFSNHFWPNYEKVKLHDDGYSVTHSELSFETKALNVLKAALFNFKNEFEKEVDFIRTLIKDLTHFKTLPKYSLRKIGSIDFSKNQEVALKELKNALFYIEQRYGIDYLDRVERGLSNKEDEIIIGIENVK